MRLAALALALLALPASAQVEVGLRLGAGVTAPRGDVFVDEDLWTPEFAAEVSFPVTGPLSLGAEVGLTRAGYATVRVEALDAERDGLSTSVILRERVRADYLTLATPLTLRLGDARDNAFVPVLTVAPRLDVRVRERADVDVAEVENGSIILAPEPRPTSNYTAVYDRYAYGIASAIGVERRTRAGAVRLEARYTRLRVGNDVITLRDGVDVQANQTFDQSHLGLRLGLGF